MISLPHTLSRLRLAAGISAVLLLGGCATFQTSAVVDITQASVQAFQTIQQCAAEEGVSLPDAQAKPPSQRTSYEAAFVEAAELADRQQDLADNILGLQDSITRNQDNIAQAESDLARLQDFQDTVAPLIANLGQTYAAFTNRRNQITGNTPVTTNARVRNMIRLMQGDAVRMRALIVQINGEIEGRGFPLPQETGGPDPFVIEALDQFIEEAENNPTSGDLDINGVLRRNVDTLVSRSIVTYRNAIPSDRDIQRAQSEVDSRATVAGQIFGELNAAQQQAADNHQRMQELAQQMNCRTTVTPVSNPDYNSTLWENSS